MSARQQREWLVIGELPARVHQTVTAASEQAARRKAAKEGAWFYADDQGDALVRIVHVEESKTT